MVVFNMKKKDLLNKIEDSGVVAVIRMDDTEKLQKTCESLFEGGILAIEITLTTPDPFNVIRRLSDASNSRFIVGAGTILSQKDAQMAIEAGAQFIVSPIFNKDIIDEALKNDVVCICGGFTPTEIYSAWLAGADIVKVFPATSAGPQYLKDIHGPLPSVKLSPTGGVDLGNVKEFIEKGACFVGVGTALTDKKMIKENDWAGLKQHASKFIQEVKKGRA